MRRHRHLDRLIETAWVKKHLDHHRKTSTAPRSQIPSSDSNSIEQAEKEFGDHHAALSRAAKHSIGVYKDTSRQINSHLRSAKGQDVYETLPDHEDDYGDTLHDHLGRLDYITSHPIRSPLLTHRGYMGKDIHKDFPVGHEFTDHGYAGTSLRPAVTHDFANARKHHFQIDLKKGQQGHYLDLTRSGSTAEEDEVLLPRGTRFRVEKHGYDAMGNKRTHLSVVSQTPSSLAETKTKKKA